VIAYVLATRGLSRASMAWPPVDKIRVAAVPKRVDVLVPSRIRGTYSGDGLHAKIEERSALH